MKRLLSFSFAIAAMMLFQPSVFAEKINVTSPAFENGKRIPVEYTCDGANASPELKWSFTGKVKSFAVTCTDPDAPGGTFVHWLIYNIPADARVLPRGMSSAPRQPEGIQGYADFGSVGYGGPCPPPGKPHRYYFTVYALDIHIGEGGLRLQSLQQKMKGHVLAQGNVMGSYGR